MKVLITGGSGFIGRELIRQLYPTASRIVVYSRSESKQAELKTVFPEYPDNKMRYLIGDVRDKPRLLRAMSGITHVIHAAALKRVEVCAYDVEECVKTNVLGSLNVAEACHESGVLRAVLISTDKAVEPITTYGASKLLAEHVFVQMNNQGPCRFAVVRYPNVEGSTGSLLQIWKKQLAEGKPLTVTHPDMTRMWITKEHAAKVVIKTLLESQGGETFVPQCGSRRILDMAGEISGGKQVEITGLRPGEKIHEMLVSEADARDCWKVDDGYMIYPSLHEWTSDFDRRGVKMPEDFRYTSKM